MLSHTYKFYYHIKYAGSRNHCSWSVVVVEHTDVICFSWFRGRYSDTMLNYISHALYSSSMHLPQCMVLRHSTDNKSHDSRSSSLFCAIVFYFMSVISENCTVFVRRRRSHRCRRRQPQTLVRMINSEQLFGFLSFLPGLMAPVRSLPDWISVDFLNDREFPRSNIEFVVSQPKIIRLSRNENKHIDWTLDLKFYYRVWGWPWPLPWIVKIKHEICHISAKISWLQRNNILSLKCNHWF